MTKKISLVQPKDRFDLLLDPLREEWSQIKLSFDPNEKNRSVLETVYREVLDFMNETVSKLTTDATLAVEVKVNAFINEITKFHDKVYRIVVLKTKKMRKNAKRA